MDTNTLKISQKEPICAPATPAGGALAVIRLSGEHTKALLETVFTGTLSHRKMSYGYLKRGEEIVDEIMASYFEAPKSYTGEDMAELYTHGGRAVIRRVLSLLFDAGFRMAEPGEFTKRAFLNGKMDLSRAEAVMDIIGAEAEQSAKAAAEQLTGSVLREINSLYDALSDAASGIAAAIDYPDELEDDVFSALPDTLSAIHARLSRLIESSTKGVYLREGYRVVLLGRPNAGKSSLLNALLGQERAIVTELAGTTRDTIEEVASFYGLPVLLTDTAGIRETEDLVESLGVARAREAKNRADLLLLCFDSNASFTKEEEELLSETEGKPRLAILTKTDEKKILTHEELERLTHLPVYSVSAKTGEGVEELKRLIAENITPSEKGVLITNARHAELLRKSCEALESAMNAHDADCIETDLQLSMHPLAEITGREATEDVIEKIFSRFCVGK